MPSYTEKVTSVLISEDGISWYLLETVTIIFLMCLLCFHAQYNHRSGNHFIPCLRILGFLHNHKYLWQILEFSARALIFTKIYEAILLFLLIHCKYLLPLTFLVIY